VSTGPPPIQGAGVIRKVVDSSLRFPVLVVGVVLGLFLAGYTQLRDMPVDALPDFAPVSVEVQSESLGLSAVEVEQLITAPMEQLLLNGVPWLSEMTSQSIPGLSSITLVFEPGTDPLAARQVVAERLSQGRDLPKVTKAPVMLQPRSSTSRLMVIRLDSATLDAIEQSVLARWTIKPALMGVPGVANVAIWGQREQQMQVQVDPRRLSERGISLSQVVTTSANSLWVSPLSYVEASTPGTGGFIDTPNQRLGVQHILPITEPADLAKVTLEDASGKPLMSGGKPVLLGDVVSVVEDHQPLIGDAAAGRTPGLMLVVEKFPEASVAVVTRGVEQTLAELAPGLEGIQFDTTIYRPGSYIDNATQNLAWALLAGLLLVVAVLGLLHGWRLALVAAITAPLSAISASLVLHLLGASMNLLLLAGLVVAMVAVIDDVVVDVDRCAQGVREQGADAGSTRVAIVAAAVEMRRPMFFASLIMLAATLPAFYIGLRHGLDAAFFRPVVLGFAAALLVSTLVTVTVVPVLSMLLLRGSRNHVPGTVGARLRGDYERTLVRGFAKPAAAVAVFGVVAVAGIGLTPALDMDVRTTLKENALLVHWRAAPGTSHPEMVRITDRVAAELRRLPGVAGVGANVGRALTSDEIAPVGSGELWLSLDPGADYDDTTAAVREVVAGYPGMEQEVLTYSAERQEAYGIGSRTADEVVVRIYGQEYDTLAAEAARVRERLDQIDGTADVTVATQPKEAQIEVRVDLNAAEKYGLTPGEVRRAAAILVAGIEVGSLFQQQKVFEVMVVGTPGLRHDLSAVKDLLIDAGDGRQVRLGDVAGVAVTSVPTVLKHSKVSRFVDVTVAVEGRGVGDVAADARAAIGAITFPLEYHSEVLRTYADQRATELDHLGLAVAAAVAILLLFQAYLRSWKLALVAFAGLPLAMSGGVLALGLAGRDPGLGTLLGALVITALYSRMVLALFGSYRRLAPGRGGRPRADVIIGGTRDRFIPVVTALAGATVLLLPMVAMGDRAGLELLNPMAVFALGGLLTTAAVTLFLLPLVYARITPDSDTAELDDTPSEVDARAQGVGSEVR
jgi:Cu/Ag efflux pump CusA